MTLLPRQNDATRVWFFSRLGAGHFTDVVTNKKYTQHLLQAVKPEPDVDPLPRFTLTRHYSK